MPLSAFSQQTDLDLDLLPPIVAPVGPSGDAASDVLVFDSERCGASASGFKFPHVAATVATRALQMLEHLEPKGECVIRPLCSEMSLRGLEDGRMVAAAYSRWAQCKNEILHNLKISNRHVPPENFESDVGLLMKVAGAIIAMDQAQHTNQSEFRIYVIQDKIDFNDEPYILIWHRDPFSRGYILRTGGRSTNFLAPHMVHGPDCRSIESLWARLLDIAQQRLPAEETEKWLQVPIKESAIFHQQITELARQTGVLWRPQKGEIVRTDPDVWHISSQPEPHEPIAGSLLLNIQADDKIRLGCNNG